MRGKDESGNEGKHIWGSDNRDDQKLEDNDRLTEGSKKFLIRILMFAYHF